MRTDELERLATRHVPGRGPAAIQQVSSGLVNDTYRVVRDGSVYALRVTSANPGDPGRDAIWEARVLERAAAANLAPVPVFYDPERGVLISRWIEGRSWNSVDVRLPENLSRMAQLVRRIHALPVPAPGRLMGPANWIERYSAAAARSRSGDRMTRIDAPLRTVAALRLAELAALPGTEPVLCHSDLHTLNVIDCGDSLVLLDWEYAHAADPFWDLAGWSANNNFDEDLRKHLLAAYAARPPTPSDNARLRLYCWLYDYVCLLWCELYLEPHRESGQFAIRARELELRLGAQP